MTVGGSQERCDLAPWYFPPEEYGFKYGIRFGRKSVQPHLFFCPNQNTCAKFIGLHQFTHKANLIETNFEEEVCELDECFFAQATTTIKVIASGQVTSSKVMFIRLLISG